MRNWGIAISFSVVRRRPFIQCLNQPLTIVTLYTFTQAASPSHATKTKATGKSRVTKCFNPSLQNLLYHNQTNCTTPIWKTHTSKRDVDLLAITTKYDKWKKIYSFNLENTDDSAEKHIKIYDVETVSWLGQNEDILNNWMTRKPYHTLLIFFSRQSEKLKIFDLKDI